MHEISIAESIVQIAEAKAREQGARSVQLIKLRLGAFSTIVPEALQFAFEVVRQGTLSHNSCLDIEIVPMVVHCAVCDRSAEPEGSLRLHCGVCGFPLEIMSGEELQVEYIEVDSLREESSWSQCEIELLSRPMY